MRPEKRVTTRQHKNNHSFQDEVATMKQAHTESRRKVILHNLNVADTPKGATYTVHGSVCRDGPPWVQLRCKRSFHAAKTNKFQCRQSTNEWPSTLTLSSLPTLCRHLRAPSLSLSLVFFSTYLCLYNLHIPYCQSFVTFSARLSCVFRFLRRYWSTC